MDPTQHSSTSRGRGAAAVTPLLVALRVYRYLLSPFIGMHCRFYPSCSLYAEQALREHGLWRGLWLSAGRLLRCHPWHAGGMDPVPAPKLDLGRTSSDG